LFKLFLFFKLKGILKMALYPQLQAGTGTNGINANLFPFEVVNKLFREWVQITPLFNLIGSEPTRPIVRREMQPGKGAEWRVGKLQALDYKNPVVNFDQRRGNAQQQTVNYDKVESDFKSFLVQIKLYDILRYATPIDLPPEASRQLVEAFSRCLNYDLFNAMTTDAYPALKTGSALVGNVAGNYPSYDRVVMPVAAGTLVTRANYQANATFPTLLNGMQTSAATVYTGSGLSAKHLETLKQYAERGNASDIAPNTEDAIQPAYVRSKAGWPMNKYIYLAHPQTLTSLFSDPLFANSTFNRGTVIDPENTPQTLNGADYVGEYRGIAIYSCRDLYSYAVTSADGNKQAAWNLFLGAGAVSLGWAEKPIIGLDNDMVERTQLYYGHEFRGQKMLQFASSYAAGAGAVAGSNTVVEQGVIHSFVSF
jgi:hypothetical protein